jgi:hypothetical protein
MNYDKPLLTSKYFLIILKIKNSIKSKNNYEPDIFFSVYPKIRTITFIELLSPIQIK